MGQRTPPANATLYETDETAWLEAAAALVRQGRVAEVDPHCLAEFLADMARRDRREVESRLTVLLTHVLIWLHQPDHRSGSWRATVVEQRQGLAGLVDRGVLRNHAEAVLADAYEQAIERAVAGTGLLAETFSAACPYSLDQLLSAHLLAEDG